MHLGDLGYTNKHWSVGYLGLNCDIVARVKAETKNLAIVDNGRETSRILEVGCPVLRGSV